MNDGSQGSAGNGGFKAFMQVGTQAMAYSAWMGANMVKMHPALAVKLGPAVDGALESVTGVNPTKVMTAALSSAAGTGMNYAQSILAQKYTAQQLGPMQPPKPGPSPGASLSPVWSPFSKKTGAF